MKIYNKRGIDKAIEMFLHTEVAYSLNGFLNSRSHPTRDQLSRYRIAVVRYIAKRFREQI
jgi:hypothetical protein